MGADKRAAFVMREMAKLHPRVAEFVQGSTAVVWEDDRWALGDFAYFKPGQIGEFFPHIQQPEGRLHFAGDTVGALPGWMQGAFASGALAARRIAASP
jgi:monoamine oxidase